MAAGAEFRRIAAGLRSLPRQWAESAAQTVAKAAGDSIRADTGGDSSLSHAPGKINVQKKVTGGGDLVTATITPGKRSMGRLTWLEDGTDPHVNQGNRPGTLHPGTAARHTWTRAVTPAVRKLTRDAERRFREVMR